MNVVGQFDSVFTMSPPFTGEYFSLEKPQSEPILFAKGLMDPEVHHYHSSPKFNSDLSEMYFSVYLSYDDPQRTFVSKKKGNKWTKPELLELDNYNAGRPVLSPNDNKLFFYSNRPDKVGDSSLRTSRIWYLEKEGNVFGEPKLLQLDSNLGISFYPDHFASDDTFYFSIKVSPRDYDMYQCKIKDDKPVELKRMNEPLSLEGKIENGSVTSPDNTILVFQAYDRNGDEKLILLACRLLQNGEWGEPKPLSKKINQVGARFASFSPDGKYFLYTSTKSGVEEIYWISSKYIFDQE